MRVILQDCIFFTGPGPMRIAKPGTIIIQNDQPSGQSVIGKEFQFSGCETDQEKAFKIAVNIVISFIEMVITDDRKDPRKAYARNENPTFQEMAVLPPPRVYVRDPASKEY